MNKSFYFLGIFFTGLYVIAALFQGLIQFAPGAQIQLRQSFLPWFFFTTTIYFIMLLAMMKYYAYKKYRFAFSSLLIVIIASFYFSIILCNALVTQKSSGFYPAASFILSGAAMLHFISLIFSVAGKKTWLKAAGILGLTLQLVLLATVIRSMNPMGFRATLTIIKIWQWASIGNNLVFVLFIVNFRAELKLVNTERITAIRQRSFKGIMVAAAIIAIVSALVLGRNLINKRQPMQGNPVEITDGERHRAELFEARVYVSSWGDTMRYRLMKPLDYDPKKKYPLVVCLHHGGAHGTDNIRQIDGSPAANILSKFDNRKKYPAFLFVPQCPPGSNWGGAPAYQGVDELVFEMIADLEKDFAIDENRRCVTGVSMGGYGSWHFICTRPKMFAAAIPVCGGGDPSLAYNIVDVPVWAFHGEKDKDVPVSFSRDMIASIKKAGGHPRYTEFPGSNHNIWGEVSITPGLFDWLFAQKRK